MVLKIHGLGIKNYLRDLFNLFDCMLVIISVTDVTLTSFMGS